MRRSISILLRLGVTISLLTLLFKRVEWAKMLDVLKLADMRFFYLAIILFFLTQLSAVLRWQFLLKAQGINLGMVRVIFSYLLCLIFNLFLPTTLGGDAARSYHLFKQTRRGFEIVASVFMDRVIGAVSLAVVAFLALTLRHKDTIIPLVPISISVLFLGSLFIFVFLIYEPLFARTLSLTGIFKVNKIVGRLKEFHRRASTFKSKPRALLSAFCLSLFIQIGGILVFYFVSRSLQYNINLRYFFLLVPIVGVASMVPVSIGGLGVRESASVFFFAKVGMGAHEALLMSLSWALFMVILVILGLLGFLLFKLSLFPSQDS